MILTVPAFLSAQAADHPEAPAIIGVDLPVLTYAQLRRFVGDTTARLNALGIRRGDRIAVVLPNGPAMATSFLSICSTATCAPLNPGYRANEFEFYLTDLNAKALLVEGGSESPAIAVAKKLGLDILRLRQTAAGRAGEFLIEREAAAHDEATASPLKSAGAAPPGETDLASCFPEDVALVLHTSGTTSCPKIVPLTQSNLCHSAQHIRDTLTLVPGDLCMNVMPLFHIHGLIGALLSSLSAGAAVACAPGFIATEFFSWFALFRPTWFTAVPTMHQAILARAPENSGAIRSSRLRFIRSSSAPLPPQTMTGMETTFGVPVIEAYGMTEASHQMASNPLPPRRRKPGSVGPAAGPEISIMDSTGNLLAAGQPGEVVIRGPNVTAAYENNPRANSDSFANGWFRTGDQGWLDEEGYLFLSGRIKEIINRGGEKISPREVDEALLEHPDIAQALAFAIPDERLGEEVGVAIVLRPGAVHSEQEIQDFAATRLADFKVPRQVILLAEIPKGPTGKPQRIGLAARLGVTSRRLDAMPGAVFRAPESAVERRLAGIWSQVLRTSDIGLESNFFDSGGDSILAAQLIARLQEEFGCWPSLTQFFRLTTLAELAAWLEAESGKSTKAAPALITKTESRRLSFSEERIWFLNEYEQDKSAYVRFSGFRLTGPLDVDALRGAFQSVMSRHDIIRTAYRADPELTALVKPAPKEFELRLVDLAAVSSEERDRELGKHAQEMSGAGFDLTSDLLLRARLLRLAEQEHLLLVSSHHIAFDGWSDTVLFREVSEVYRAAVTEGQAPSLLSLPFQYRDFAEWQRAQLTVERKRELLAYWADHLSGLPPLLPLPLDHSRPPHQTYRGAREFLTLDQGLERDLRQLARRENVTFFIPLLSAFAALLSRYCGVEDLAIATAVANRPTADTERLIGCFVNTLVLRLNLRDDPSGAELLERVRQTTLGALDHQELPFELLVECMNPSRSLSYYPLVQVMFQLRNLPERAFALKGLRAEELEWDFAVSQFDLSLDLVETNEGVSCKATYNRQLFERETITRLLSHYQTLLRALVKTPEKRLSELSPLDDQEQLQLLVEFNATAVSGADVPVARLFEETAAAWPDRVALRFEGGEVRYQELNRRANRLARYMAARGVTAGDRVAVWLERSPESVLSLLALFKLGASYVPLDLDLPAERVRFMVEDAAVSLTLTVSRLESSAPSGIPTVCVDRLPEAELSADNLESQPDLDGEAYVMFTSGSTGKPKGVPVLQRGPANFASWFRREFGGRNTHATHAASLTFDLSFAELMIPLLTGASITIISDEVWRDPERLIASLHRCRPGCLVATPSFLRVLLDGGVFREAKSLEWILSCGETLSPDLARRFMDETNLDVVNTYGPTENTVITHWFWVKREEDYRTVPIGRPISNTTAYVLGPRKELLPIGATGELYLGGRGVARGYLDRPDLTAERFVPNPFANAPGDILFKTGDLARFRCDGLLEHLGRADSQVKIRGYRVELGEVEAVLSQHPDVAQVAVLVRSFGPDDLRLIAHIVRRPEANGSDEASLREYLARFLPTYMVPSRFVFMDRLPLTPSAKVDRKALASTPLADSGERREGRPPADRVEADLIQLWSDLLKVGSVGVDDNFFDLGGHSLLAVRLFVEIERRFSRRLPLATLFETPTIAGLAARLRENDGAGEWKSLVAIRPRGGHPPLFCVHAADGDVVFYRDLALLLGEEQAVFALRSRGLEGSACLSTVEEMAARYVEEIRTVQAAGPYFLAGFCLGAYVAFEMARLLTRQGEQIALLANFTTDGSWKTATSVFGQLRYHRVGVAAEGAWRYLTNRLVHRSRAISSGAAVWIAGRRQAVPPWLRRSRVHGANRRASVVYRARPWPGQMVYFQGDGDRHRDFNAYWGPLVLGGLDVRQTPGSQIDIFKAPHVRILADVLTRCLEEARRKASDARAAGVAGGDGS